MTEVQVGDVVWQQMLPGGRPYGERRRMVVRAVHPEGDVVRWWLAPVDRPNDESAYSYVDSSWCVLEREVQDGALF